MSLTPEEREKIEEAPRIWEADRLRALKNIRKLEVIFEQVKKDPRFPMTGLRFKSHGSAGVSLEGRHKRDGKWVRVLIPHTEVEGKEIAEVLENVNRLCLKEKARERQPDERTAGEAQAADPGGHAEPPLGPDAGGRTAAGEIGGL